MAAVALALYLTFLATAFGLRTLMQYRRTGSTGFNGFTGRPGSLEWWGGVLFVVALVVGLAGPVLQLAGAVDALPVLDTTAARVLGLVLAVAGIAGTLAAQQTMGASWRVGVDTRETTRLVTGGTFALVRNPIYTTMITASLGLALLAPNVVAVPGPAVLLAAIEIHVRAVEEPYLLRTHGQAYRDYAARAGRFVPGVGRLAAPGHPRP
jgi:protein-S-isoprenylcysteine O-methyltransferase Ste14